MRTCSWRPLRHRNAMATIVAASPRVGSRSGDSADAVACLSAMWQSALRARATNRCGRNLHHGHLISVARSENQSRVQKTPARVVERKAAKRRPLTKGVRGVSESLNLETIRWRAVVVFRGRGNDSDISRAKAGKLAGMSTSVLRSSRAPWRQRLGRVEGGCGDAGRPA